MVHCLEHFDTEIPECCTFARQKGNETENQKRTNQSEPLAHCITMITKLYISIKSGPLYITILWTTK